MDEQLAVTSQQEQGHGSATTTAESLTSLVRQARINEGTSWMLLVERSTNSFAILEGINKVFSFPVGNDELELVAFGDAEYVSHELDASRDAEYVSHVEWRRAKDIQNVIGSLPISVRGCPIYRLAESEVQLSPGTAEVPRLYVQQLSNRQRVYLAAAVAAANNVALLSPVSAGIDKTSESAGYELPELPIADPDHSTVHMHSGRPIQTSDQTGFGASSNIPTLKAPRPWPVSSDVLSLASRHWDAQIERAMSMPSFDSRTDTLLPGFFKKDTRTHGLHGGRHHPEITRGYATTANYYMNMMMATATNGAGIGGVHDASQQRLGLSLADSDLEAGGGGVVPTQEPLASISAERCNCWESAGYYGRPELASRHVALNQGYTPTSDVNRIATVAGSGTSTGGHSLGNLLAADGGSGPGHLESHGSSHISRWGRRILNAMMTIAGYDTTVTGGGEADLEAGEQADGGAAPSQQPSVNEEVEEAKTLRHFFIQTYATLLPASAMAYPVLQDAPKHVKLIIFGGLMVIITIVLFAGILSRSLARRRLAFRLVSCSAVALLTFSIASQLS